MLCAGGANVISEPLLIWAIITVSLMIGAAFWINL